MNHYFPPLSPLGKFIIWISLCCFLSPSYGANLHKFSRFKNFNSTYFNNQSGKPILTFSFHKITQESPKIAFLRFAIPFFYIENLYVHVEMDNMQSQSLLRDIKQFHKKEAIRFLQARKVKVHIHFKEQKDLLITSKTMKLKKEGGYLFSGEVTLKVGKDIFNYPTLYVTFQEGKGSYIIEKRQGETILQIFEPSHFLKSELNNVP